MATPPDSGGIFLSFSPTRHSSDLSEEVDVLLARARMVDRLSPTTNSFIATHRNAFFKTFERQINLIRSRSQAFQDSHVTVFDKVLLELTQDGHYLDHPAAIQYFCEEFLAIPANVSGEQATEILSDAVVASVPFVPAQAITPPPTHRGSISAQDTTQDSPPKKFLFGHELDSRSVFLATLARDVGPAAARLWTVYDQAKQDFFAVTDSNSTEKQNTARFLRDTAENTLHYLQDKVVDRQLLEDLEKTFNVAKQTVTTFYGGRKRKFDHAAYPRPFEWTRTTRTTHNNSLDTEGEHWTRVRDSSVFEQPARGEFAGHARALAKHRRLTPPENMTQGQRGAVLELFPQEQRPKQKRKNQQPQTQPGRGHSNVPFGYSRPVDSYHPGS